MSLEKTHDIRSGESCEVFTPKQAAAYMKCSVKAVREWRRTGKLRDGGKISFNRLYRQGADHSYFFTRQELDRFLSEYRTTKGGVKFSRERAEWHLDAYLLWSTGYSIAYICSELGTSEEATRAAIQRIRRKNGGQE